MVVVVVVVVLVVVAVLVVLFLVVAAVVNIVDQVAHAAKTRIQVADCHFSISIFSIKSIGVM